MAKAVAEFNGGSIDTDLLGNILAPQYKGWTNNSPNYYTRTGSDQWKPGSPFMGQPTVYNYQSGQGLFRWFPTRPPGIRGIVPGEYSGTLEKPPIDNLSLAGT